MARNKFRQCTFFLTNHRHRKRGCGVWCASLSAVTLNSYCVFLWQNRTKSHVRAVHGAEGQMHKRGYLQIFCHLFFFLSIYSVACFLTPISVSLKRIQTLQFYHLKVPPPSKRSASCEKFLAIISQLCILLLERLLYVFKYRVHIMTCLIKSCFVE